MAAEVEIKLRGMSDTGINCCTCWDVAALPNLHTFTAIQQLLSIFTFNGLTTTVGQQEGHQACDKWFIDNLQKITSGYLAQPAATPNNGQLKL